MLHGVPDHWAVQQAASTLSVTAVSRGEQRAGIGLTSLERFPQKPLLKFEIQPFAPTNEVAHLQTRPSGKLDTAYLQALQEPNRRLCWYLWDPLRHEGKLA